MKAGDIVTIYHDPITQQIEEGKARLIRKEEEFGDGLEYWSVWFMEPGVVTQVQRTIKAETRA